MKLTKGVSVLFWAVVLVWAFAAFINGSNAGTYWSSQLTDQAPLPFNPFPQLGAKLLPNGQYQINDTYLDYPAIYEAIAESLNDSAELSATAKPFTFGGGGFAPLFSFPSNSLWIEWSNIDLTNLTASILVHGTIANNFYQLLSTENLTNFPPPTNQNLILGAILTNSAGLDPMIVTNVSISKPGTNFYLVHATNTIASISTTDNGIAFAPTDTNGTGAVEADFIISRTGTNLLTVNYTISGTALNGVDYTAISSSVLIDSSHAEANVPILPLFTTNVDFSRVVTLTLSQSVDYLIDTNQGPSATIIIGGNNNGNQWFQFVSGVTNGVGLAYHAPSNRLILSVEFESGDPVIFTSLDTNANFQRWSHVSIPSTELQLACVPPNLTNANFTNGDLFYFTDTPGQIGWLSADGTRSNLNWLTLTGESNSLSGNLCFDTNGAFGFDLLVITGPGASGDQDGGGVWRIHSQTNATLLASLHTYAEAMCTFPNDPKYGPWADKLVVGLERGQHSGSTNAADRSPPCLLAMDTNGVTTPFFLGLSPENIKLVQTNQDFYVQAVTELLKLPRNLLTNHVGEVLIGEGDNPVRGRSVFSLVRWNTNSLKFDQTYIVPAPIDYEQGVFAPLDIPATDVPGH